MGDAERRDRRHRNRELAGNGWIEMSCVLSKGSKHHFFGYYGICPWDRAGKCHLALETDFHTRAPQVDDTYPEGPERKSRLLLYDLETHRLDTLGTFAQMAEATSDWRYDLHPRWANDSQSVTFDSTHEGSRQIHRLSLNQNA